MTIPHLIILERRPAPYRVDNDANIEGAMSYRTRAADASHSSLLRVSTIGGIAIAALTVLYFAAQFVRGVL